MRRLSSTVTAITPVVLVLILILGFARKSSHNRERQARARPVSRPRRAVPPQLVGRATGHDHRTLACAGSWTSKEPTSRPAIVGLAAVRFPAVVIAWPAGKDQRRPRTRRGGPFGTSGCADPARCSS